MRALALISRRVGACTINHSAKIKEIAERYDILEVKTNGIFQQCSRRT